MKKSKGSISGGRISQPEDQENVYSSPETGTESDSSFRSIFGNTLDAIYVLDEKGVFIDVNPAAMKMYGYAWNEMVGLLLPSYQLRG